MNYYNETRYFLRPERKQVRLSKKPSLDEKDRELDGRPSSGRILNFLERNSRLYGVSLRILAKLTRAIGKKAENNYRSVVFADFEPRHFMGQSERQKMTMQFEESLKAIAEKARADAKTVIMIAETSEETFSPMCSVIESSIPHNEQEEIKAEYYKARRFYLEKNYAQANQILQPLLQRAPTLANAQHLAGLLKLNSAVPSSSWPNFRKAIDNDCFPFRTLSSVHQTMMAFQGRYPNVITVYPPATFRGLRESGYSASDLFTDWVHPTMLGHYVLSLLTARAIEVAGLLNNDVHFDTDIIKRPLRTELGEIAKKLSVTKDDSKQRAFMSARWNISYAFRAGDPRNYLAWGKAQLNEFLQLADGSPDEMADGYMYLALAYAVEGDSASATRFLNQASELSAARIQARLFNDVMAHGDSMINIFNRAKIQFDQKTKLFTHRNR